ncbi:hypothetical protein CK203_067502 [Vitis vinifera]|uniref:DUF4283 domain-containing protein n=1 Tax=Vitis vinifera TaxID=29760 RepID=A0A438EB29_VITVI|nr:hypothetical protein CK203_067502 [Vitis vinifera]
MLLRGGIQIFQDFGGGVGRKAKRLHLGEKQREVINRTWAFGWEEGNRKYRLERRSNEAGRFILCLAPKGPEVLLREKEGSKVQWREKGVELKSYAEAVKTSPGRVGRSIWLEVGEREVRGRRWATQHWDLKGNMRIARLGRGLLLFEFESSSEAECVLATRSRNIKENVIILDRWNPEVGCLCKDAGVKEAWVVPTGGFGGEDGSREGEDDDGTSRAIGYGSQREKLE